jgi:peptide/nickel transport system permease protein
VLLRHALPNALGPTIQVLALTIAWLTGGVVVVEAVFQFNGVGLALTGAVSSRDVPTVQAIAMLIAAVYVGLNLLSDIATVLLNPRLRRRQRP